MKRLFALLVAAAALSSFVGSAQQPAGVQVAANSIDQLRTWDSTIDGMVRANQLVVLNSLADPDIDGRRHESLAQYYLGIPVYGGSLSRQTAQGVSVSIIGTVFNGISIDTTPALSEDQIVRALADVSGGRLVNGPPRLVIFPSLDGRYRLAYQATMSDMKTYIVDAGSGGVLLTSDEITTQTQIGVGTGVLGDMKKMSTTQIAGGFRTHDQLRPAPIRTFDTHGSDVALNRLQLPPGAAVDSDFSVDADNTWSDPPVVDTHVNAGFMEDYLFKQHSWTGIDNRRGTITTAVHTGLVNNAFFIGPPFGPEGRGLFVFGSTTAGVPLTVIDIVAHEMMHGVTNAALTQRTGIGLLTTFNIDRLGPTAYTSGGATFPCDTTDFVVGATRFPMYCIGGRYVLASNHGGTINEAFSDVFGISAEFFHQPAGTGPLRADYKLGEDVTGFGPNRAADVPASLVALGSSLGPLVYPDHASRGFSFLVAIAQGTRTNPIAMLGTTWTLQGDQLAMLGTNDTGGVHVNSTILSHAFYLAIEGGRNATSGITVQGVGSANRAQIERSFFRGMTVLMPNAPTMQVAAQATLQGAIDLYGANGSPALAIRQAMQAVGLMN